MENVVFVRALEWDLNDLAQLAYMSWLKKSIEQAIATCLDEFERKDEFWIMRNENGVSLWYVSWRREWDRENWCYELYHIGVNSLYKWWWIWKKIFVNFEQAVAALYKEHWQILRKIRLKTWEWNSTAHAFYETMGMQKIAELPNHFRDKKTEYVYEKYYNI